MQYIANLWPIILMVVIFYLMVFVPESRRKKKYTNMINSLKINDEIITTGGVMGKIVNIQDDYIILQTGPDKARIKVSKTGVFNVLGEGKAE